MIVELVGINGTGKSSIYSHLLRTRGLLSYHSVIKIKWYDYIIIFFKNSCTILRMLFQRKELRFIRIYCNLIGSIEVLKESNVVKNDIVLADQGLVFQLAVLKEERAINDLEYRNMLDMIKRLVTNVIYLYADIPTLYGRVKQRSYSQGRGQYMSKDEFETFCISHLRRFDQILQHIDRVERINSGGELNDTLLQIQSV